MCYIFYFGVLINLSMGDTSNARLPVVLNTWPWPKPTAAGMYMLELDLRCLVRFL